MFCPECGTKNKENSKFCFSCGFNFVETEPAPEVTEAKPRRSELEEGIKLDNRYRLITIIEKGGMGAVYKAMDTRLDNICAIKEMRENFERDEYRIYAIEKFKSEALILSKLRHPNIPRVFDYFIEKDRYYLAMDYIEGQTLFRVMHKRKDKRLEEEELVEWTLQLCDVLAYLHNQDPPIIYRDIKPANIMINSEKRIMLIDFGIARIFNPKSKGTMIGTQGYSPPEQYRGQVDPRSDIYALGATLHHLITGKDPQLDAPFSFPPVRELREELSDRLSYAIDKCLKFNMEDRFSCVEELRDHLENRSPVNIEVEKPPQPEPEEEIPAPPEEKKEKKSGILASELENLLFSIEEASTTITNRTPPVSQESTEKTQEKPVKKPVFEPGEPEEEIPIPREVSATELTIPEKTRPEPKPEPVKKPKPKPRKKSLLDDLSLGGISFNELKEEEEEEDPFDLLQVEDDGRDSQLFDELLMGDDDEEELIIEVRPDSVKPPKLKKSGNGIPAARPTIAFGPIDIKSKLKKIPRKKNIIKKTPRRQNDFSLDALPGSASDDSEIPLLPAGNDPYGLHNSGGEENLLDIPGLQGKPEKAIPASKPKFNITQNASQSFKKYSVENKSSWYMHRGDATHSALNREAPLCRGNLKWRFHSNGRIYSSPVLDARGNVYFTSNDGCLYALDKNGKELWRYITDNSLTVTPLVLEGIGIFFGSEDYHFYGVSFEGKELWRFRGGDVFKSSPVCDRNGNIYVGCNDGNMYGIAPDGKELWRYTINTFIQSSPAISSDDVVYVGAWDKNLYALTLEGELLWKFTTGDIVDSSPATDGVGNVYVGSNDGFLYAINHLGHEKWKFRTKDIITSSPAVHKEKGIFVGSNDNFLYNVNFDGSHRWHVRTNYCVNSSPAVDNEGNVYVGSDDFSCYCFNSRGDMRWKFKTNASVESSPCLAEDGTLYFGSHDGWLYCLE